MKRPITLATSRGKIFVWTVGLLLLFAGCTKQTEEAGAPVAEAPAQQSPTPAPSQSPPTPPAEQTTRETAVDFPLPIMEGLKVESTLTTSAQGRRGKQLALTGNIPPSQVANFYEAEFRKRGLQIRKTQADSAHEADLLMLGESETVTAGLMVVRDPESGETKVVLSWSATEEKP